MLKCGELLRIFWMLWEIYYYCCILAKQRATKVANYFIYTPMFTVCFTAVAIARVRTNVTVKSDCGTLLRQLATTACNASNRYARPLRSHCLISHYKSYTRLTHPNSTCASTRRCTLQSARLPKDATPCTWHWAARFTRFKYNADACLLPQLCSALLCLLAQLLLHFAVLSVFAGRQGTIFARVVEYGT